MEFASALFFAIVITTILYTPYILISFKKKSREKSFIEALKKGLITGKITYSDLQHIAEYWNQNRKSILYGLRKMLSKATSGDGELVGSIQFIRDLLETHQENEPFAELPENISLQLADIQNNPDKNKIGQLAASLSTLYISHQRSLLKEKNLTKAGFAIGIAGIIWSVVTFFIQ